MNHKIISLFSTSKIRGAKIPATLVVVGSIFLLAALYHSRHKNLGQTARQRLHTIKAGAFNIPTAPQYRIRFKTAPLDSFYKNGRFPSETSLVVDGKQVYAASKIRFIDQFLVLSKGSHTAVIKMWDSQHKILEKKYQLNVGVSSTEKVAKN